jgi:hypothetical protein
VKPTSHRIYFVDTSYLDELYAVPGFSDVQAIPQVRKRFELAWKAKDRLFVPLGVLLEFGNHIAKIRNDHDRAKWARHLHEVVVAALDPTKQSRPFVLTEAPALDDTELLVRLWRDKHVNAPRELVDAATAEKAAAFKRERAMGNPVHIWTRDQRLKRVEPDHEPDAFV